MMNLVKYAYAGIVGLCLLWGTVHAQEVNCTNGVDDDGDYYYDCIDSDCANSSYCENAWGCPMGLFEYSATQIYRWNMGTNGRYELMPAAPPLEMPIRALAHNEMDGYLYGISADVPCQLVRVDNQGRVKKMGVITNEALGDTINPDLNIVAAVCRKGELLIYYKDVKEMHRINITTDPTYRTQIMKLNMVSNVVFDAYNDLLYTFDTYGQLHSIYPNNQTTGQVGKMMGLKRGKGAIYHGVWMDKDQRLWVRHRDEDAIYEIKKEKNQANQFLVQPTKIDNTILGSWSCTLAKAPFVEDILYLNTELQQGNTLIRINWGIMDEKGREGYQLEHSMDGKDWELMGQMKSSYNYPDQLNPYGELDRNIETPKYYRVRKVGFGGAYSYSPTIYHLPNPDAVEPIEPQVILSPERGKTEAQLLVLGMWQQPLLAKVEKLGTTEQYHLEWMVYSDVYTIPIDLTTFSSGTYFWVFFDKNGHKIGEQKLFME